MRKKAVPVGIEDFERIINEDYYYVDKTMLIEELLINRAPVTLFTRPRRFGKTLNMSMLRYFFDVKDKEENKKLFENLKISNSEYMSEQGKYPVIFISLKDLKGNSWKENFILIKKYIKGKIINDDLYGLNSSLYSVAATTYRPLMLKEHFRCVPEIIGYSNKTSYDLKIKPLRESGSSNLKPAVINYKVPGMRDEKRKINELEAKTVVSLIKACMEMKEYADSSFGVISLLGDEQSDLIQKMIVEKIDVTDIEKHDILCGNSSHFQGDERDVIFLTMVDSNSGEVPLRVMTDGTESARKKRYNVAASRAKNQMWVVNSLDIDNDLKTGDIRKEFLEYVSSPKEMLLTEEMEKNSESVFEEKIAKYLISEGYHIEQQWEAGLYKIDMVALFQDKKVAIECDGEKWHSTEEQIREDMERQNVLERCGWEFIRIRGSRYFKNPESAMKTLIEELNRKGIYPESMEDKRYLTKEKELLNKIKNRALKIIKF